MTDHLVQGLLRHLEERTCLSAQLLDLLVAGSLPDAAAREIGGHLRDCLRCLHVFSRLQSLHDSAEPRPTRLVDSPSARGLRVQMSQLAAMDDDPRGAPPILIAGEAGTGKGLVAREIHALSRRAARAFVEVECAALSPARLERELFGVDCPGLFEAADGGTLFLDTIEALSPGLQTRLLGVLDDRSVRRVTGGEARSLDVRLLAATHIDLAQAVHRGAVRADLVARFRTSTVTLLPLRERPDDILPLARHFADQAARREGEATRLTSAAERRLRGYAWPGNVRELSQVIERAARRRAEIGIEELGLPLA